jgi:hypothetical protein
MTWVMSGDRELCRLGSRRAASCGSTVERSNDSSGTGPNEVRRARGGDESEVRGICLENPEMLESRLVEKSGLTRNEERGVGNDGGWERINDGG